MRNVLAQCLEAIGLGMVVSGVLLLAGFAGALIAGGVVMVLAAMEIDRRGSP